MDTPICDFVRHYAESGIARLHMPGHKGKGPLGIEHLDITEICGADSLYEAEGIIAQSEANASWLFGCPTFYSTEGSSQCIRAMVYLAMLDAKAKGKPLRIAAGRNAHKTFLSAAALLDADVVWLYPNEGESYLSCTITPQDVEALANVSTLYLTSPDYLGNLADISAISAICRQKGILLLVDNAHGAYLRFLPSSLHPIDQGADLCCDSAHKTLPVLTGGAYLHLRDAELAKHAKDALALFGSTSPSYLILQSLDAANSYLAGDYRQQLAVFCQSMQQLRTRLSAHGYHFIDQEPMKLTIEAKRFGYTGTELAHLLRQNGVECEFADPDYLVLMPTLQSDLSGLQAVLLRAEPRTPFTAPRPSFFRPEKVLSIREATLSASRLVPIADSLGKILAAATVGCPPAVPIVVCGERISPEAIQVFQYYGIETCRICE
jgi:arginine/lysine/ornithine decarboxylase